MDERKRIELIVVIAVYFLAYFLLAGPLLGSVFGFAPALVITPERGSTIGRILTTPRGWILLLGFFPVLFIYMRLRARIAGVSTGEYWSQ